MGDLLSAASLLLAVIAVLYGLWYPEIIKAIATNVPAHERDRAKPRKDVCDVLYSSALPLTGAALLLILVFLPDAVSIFIQSFKNYWGEGFQAITRYSAVSTSFVLVVCLSLALVIYLAYFTYKLFRLRDKLK